MKKLLSIVIPSYNEEKMINKTYSTISKLMSDNKISYEMIFVDDGSRDNTWNNIEKISKKYPNVVGVHFSRNFGKEAAIIAGLKTSLGNCAVVIDCDLQHPPIKIVEMYRLWEEGYEVVEAVKSDRGKESFFHAFAAKTFYKLISGATNIDMQSASDFKLLDRKAIDVLLTMKEKDSFFRALSSWIGFKATKVSFEVQERTEGESKWSTKSLIRYALTNITSFSNAPMQLVTIMGVVMLFFSFVMSIITIVEKINGVAQDGFSTVIIMQGISSSFIMLSLGIIGFYLAKIYEETKDRPKYIISEVVESKNSKATNKNKKKIKN